MHVYCSTSVVYINQMSMNKWSHTYKYTMALANEHEFKKGRGIIQPTDCIIPPFLWLRPIYKITGYTLVQSNLKHKIQLKITFN